MRALLLLLALSGCSVSASVAPMSGGESSKQISALAELVQKHDTAIQQMAEVVVAHQRELSKGKKR